MQMMESEMKTSYDFGVTFVIFINEPCHSYSLMSTSSFKKVFERFQILSIIQATSKEVVVMYKIGA
jgi:hypothetical protein